jgi:hypothetical protein
VGDSLLVLLSDSTGLADPCVCAESVCTACLFCQISLRVGQVWGLASL